MNILTQIIKLIVELIAAAIVFIFEFIEMAITGIPRKNRSYKAKFVSPGTLFSRRHQGFCMTGKRNLSVKNSYQNALVVGGTGTGKSSVVLIPSLYAMRSSFIIHDPAGELLTKSGGYLLCKGHEVRVLNFTDPGVSCGYNPLTRAKSSSDIQKVASLLVENALGKGKDPFWNTQAAGLLAMMIAIVKKQEPEYQNLYNVRQLLNQLGSDPEFVDTLFSRHASDVLFSEYKSFLAYDDKVVNGIIATAKAALQIFSDESVAKVTSFDSLDFQEFRNKPIALYIQNSVADQKYYSVITSLFFEQFFSFLLGRFPEDGEKDIFLLVDEASSLNLPTLPLAVANVRKHRSGIMLLVQDFSQLVHNYGKNDAEAIRSNCFAKMYFTGQSLETTRELEATMGKFEYEDDKGQKIVRSLMTNDEIRTLKPNRAILICGHERPIMARLRPFYKKRLFRGRSLIPYHPPKAGSCPGPVPTLKVEVSEASDDHQAA